MEGAAVPELALAMPTLFHDYENENVDYGYSGSNYF